MSLQAKDVDSITFPTAIRGYAEHAVDEFVDQFGGLLKRMSINACP
jgi:DivIVA domain-containing protein